MNDAKEIEKLRAENEELRQHLQHVLLENSIHNEIDPPNNVAVLGEYFGCNFSSDYLLLAVIRAKADPIRRHTSPLSVTIHSEDTSAASKENDIIYYPVEALACVEEICERYLYPRTNSLVFRADKDVGILLNPNARYIAGASITSGNYLASLKRTFINIIADLDTLLGFDNTATISAVHSSPLSLFELYGENKHTYDYSWNLENRVHTFSEMQSTPMSARELLELSNLEKEFLSDAEHLLFYEASVVLDTILDYHLRHADRLSEILTSTTARMRTVLAIVQMATSLEDNDLDQMNELIHKLSACESIPEMRDRVHDCFASLADFVPQQNRRKGEMVLEYINNNAANPSLNAQMICDRFRISNTYLSRLIKKETGKKLVDCIHACRIENAKLLLRDTNLGIEQIAVQTGFSNRYGLIRAFRTAENMTPSEYREKASES